MDRPSAPTCYLPPEVLEYPAKWLVGFDGTNADKVFLFFDRIEIGRYNPKRLLPGHLLVDDQTVSSHHCESSRNRTGAVSFATYSRNGTRVDGRRLSPNLTTAFEVGQVVQIGRDLELRLDGQPPQRDFPKDEDTPTFGVSPTTTVTILVCDIRNFTTLVRLAGLRRDPEIGEPGLRNS